MPVECDEDSFGDTGTSNIVEGDGTKGRSFVDIKYKKRAVDFWRNEGGKQRSFKNVQHNFKQLQSCSKLYRWEQQVLDQGTRHDKLKYVANEVLTLFKAARSNKKMFMIVI